MTLHVVRQVRITVLDADDGPIDPTLESMGMLLDAAEKLGIKPEGEPLISDEHHMVEVYLHETNLCIDGVRQYAPEPEKPAKFVRGRVNINTAEAPAWRAARRYPDGSIMYLDEGTGRQSSIFTMSSRDTFIAEGDES